MLERGKRSDIYSLFFFPVEVRDGTDTQDKGMGVPPSELDMRKRMFQMAKTLLAKAGTEKQSPCL